MGNPFFGERTITDIAKHKRHGAGDRLFLIYYPGASDEDRYVMVLDMDDVFTQLPYSLDSVATMKNVGAGSRYYYTDLDVVDHEHIVGILDGKPYRLEADSESLITFPTNASLAVVGTLFHSTFGFLSKEIPSNGDSSIYNRRRMKKATVNVFQSLGGRIGTQFHDESKMMPMLSARYGEVRYGEQPHIVDEIIDMDINSSNMRSAELYITTDEPTPLNILSIKEKIEILET